MTRVVAVLLCLAASSCATFVPPPTMLGGVPFAPEEAWATVLSKVVDDHGRVNFGLLTEERHDLDLYLAYVARVGPRTNLERFPTRSDSLAHYINSYNALAMFGVITHHMPKGFYHFFERARFFKLTEYQIGGEAISLYDYENELIRPLGEPRVHFALNCMAVGCPRLPRTPFRAEHLDRQLDESAREFFNNEKHVRVEPKRRLVWLSEILKFYNEDFVNDKVAPSLVAYVNRYRDTPIPAGFAVKFIDYDWTVNRQ